MLKSGACAGYIDADLGEFRVHSTSISGSQTNLQKYREDWRRVFRETQGREWGRGDQLWHFLYKAEGLLIRSGMLPANPKGRRTDFHLKIAVLWYALSGYLNACLKELATREGVWNFSLLIKRLPYMRHSKRDQVSWIENQLVWRSQSDLGTLKSRLSRFAPEIQLICGWAVPAYRKVARKSSGKCLRVMTMDNCWLATGKQKFATLISPWYVRPLADLVWLPGERQAIFARKLGFGNETSFGGFTPATSLNYRADPLRAD